MRSPLRLGHFGDFRGKRICLGAKGSSTEANARRILETAGMAAKEYEPINCDMNTAIEALRDGQIDILFLDANVPSTDANRLMETGAATLFEMPQELIEHLINKNAYFARSSITSGTYPNQDGSIATIRICPVLLVGASLDPEAVYAITAGLVDSPSFASAVSYESLNVPLHPGARKLLEERGLIRRNHWLAYLIGSVLLLGAVWKMRRHEKQIRRRIKTILIDVSRVPPYIRALIFLGSLYLMGSMMLYVCERRVNDFYSTPGIAAWSALINWINIGAKEPLTIIGRTTSILMTMLGLGGILWLTTKFCEELVRVRLSPVHRMHQDHYLIINWNEKGAGIIKQLRNRDLPKRQIIVLTQKHGSITHVIDKPEAYTHVAVDDIDADALEKAAIKDAFAVVILTDSLAHDTEAKDGRNILLTLRVIEACKGAVKPNIIVELIDPSLAEASSVLKGAGQFEVVSNLQIAEHLIAQAAVTPGLTKIYDELLTVSPGSPEIYCAPIPARLHGVSIDDLFVSLVKLRLDDIDIIPVAIDHGGHILVNPSAAAGETVGAGDKIYAMCDTSSDLSAGLDRLYFEGNAISLNPLSTRELFTAFQRSLFRPVRRLATKRFRLKRAKRAPTSPNNSP